LTGARRLTRLAGVVVRSLGSRLASIAVVCAALCAALSGSALAAGQTDLEWPASGSVSQTPAQHKASFENQWAVDIANGGAGVPVAAAYDGTVVASFNHVPGGACGADTSKPAGYGNVVVLRHDAGSKDYYTMYGHLSSRSVSVGARVRQRQQVGVMGSTGCATGQHVHFQIGTCVNASGLITAVCSLWNPPAPAYLQAVSRGAAVGSSYPGLAYPLWHYAGQIVQWNGDTKPQKTSWIVGGDTKRRWVPDTRTYGCLRARGTVDAGPLSSSLLDQLPDLNGIWAQCPYGDVNYDGKVNIFDLSGLLTAYGRTGAQKADDNYDGAVNIFDLSILLSNYGRTS
jgi:murein DD-endopeptidase MepM/ murein hydrolase activator NlpD